MIWLDRDLQWTGLASGKRGRSSAKRLTEKEFKTITGLQAKDKD